MPPVLPISLLKMRRILPHLVLGVNLNRPPRSSQINDRSAMQNQTEDEQNDERQDENTKTSQKDIYDHTQCHPISNCSIFLVSFCRETAQMGGHRPPLQQGNQHCRRGL